MSLSVLKGGHARRDNREGSPTLCLRTGGLTLMSVDVQMKLVTAGLS